MGHLIAKTPKKSQNLKELIESKDINCKTDKVDPFSNIKGAWVYLNYNISEWCS